MEFAQDIKHVRIKALLSQASFAKELGVSFSTVNRWEAGRAKPRYDTMKKISDFCEARGIPFEIKESYFG